MTERVGPLIKGSESIETGKPEECKFYTHLIFLHQGLYPAFDYPICLHPEVCRPSLDDGPYYRTEKIGCNPDNCPFIQKIEKKEFSGLTFEDLAQEEIIQLPKEARFHLAYNPFWPIPPKDFFEKVTSWGLFSSEDADRMEELLKKINPINPIKDPIASTFALAELGMIIRKSIEKRRR